MAPLKEVAMSQITRCRNCTVAYTAANPEQCIWDEASDGGSICIYVRTFSPVNADCRYEFISCSTHFATFRATVVMQADILSRVH